MKKALSVFAVFCSIITLLSPLSVYATDQEVSRGEFAKHLAESMGITYQLGPNPQAEDYINLLRKEGIKIPADFETSKTITKEEKADLLSQALAIERKTEPKGKEDTQIFRDKAIIIKVNGNVLIKRQKEAEWTPAIIDMQLVEGDYIKTDKESSALLRVGVAGRIEIKENSELAFQSLATQKDKKSENILLYLAMGEIFVDVKGLDEKSKFETHTPTTVAAVRGTTYIVKVEPAEGKTEVREKK
jgi:hypothetical protein